MSLVKEFINELLFSFEMIFSGEYGLTLSGSWFYLVCILIIFLVRNRKQPLDYLFIRGSYVVYITMLIYYVFLPIPVNRLGIENAQIMYGNPTFDSNYFTSIIPIYGVLHTGMIRQFILNIIMFFPFGIYYNVFNEDVDIKTTILKYLKFSISIELIQLAVALLLNFQYRFFDFNDIIANVFGGVLGYIVYKYAVCVVYKKLANKEKFYVQKKLT